MAKKSQALAPPASVEIESPEAQLVQIDGDAITRWVQGARAFFKQATELELGAKSFLIQMEGVKLPTNGDQDAQLQDLIRIGKSGRKEIEAHWTIAGILDKLHKRAVQGRKRGTDAYDLAEKIGNDLHLGYKQAEQRRVDAENDRRRRETEEEARRKREDDLRVLEEQALKAEASSPGLSDRERTFVDLIASGRPMLDAAKRAGYKDPGVMGPRLLSTAKIKQAIQARQDAAAARQQAEAVREAPVQIEPVLVRPDIQKWGDRTTWSAEVLDERAFVQAVMSGSFGIPLDCLSVNQVKLNEYARSLRENLDRWPGVRAKMTTKVL